MLTIAGERPVLIVTEWNTSMNSVSKLADFVAGTRALKPTDRESSPFVGRLSSPLDPAFAGSRSAQSARRVSATLTARERDVLSMMSQGFSNKRIARALMISPETVKSHVKRIFLKLAVSTRTEAVFRAGSLGLL